MRREFFAVDAARAFAALLVVAIHVQPFADVSFWGNVVFTESVARQAVPFFFTVTGFLLGGRFSDGKLPVPAFSHCLRRIGVLYAVWCTLYVPLAAVHLRTVLPPCDNVVFWLRSVILTGPYHLWYFPSLMEGLVLVFLVGRWLTPMRQLLCSGAVYAGAVLIGSYGVGGWMPLSMYYDPLYLGWAFAWFFLSLGIWGARRDFRRVPVWFYFAALAGLLAEAVTLHLLRPDGTFYLYLAMPFVIVGLFRLLADAEPFFAKMGKGQALRLRRCSVLIYGVHIYFVWFFWWRPAGRVLLADMFPLLPVSLAAYGVVILLSLVFCGMILYSMRRGECVLEYLS